MIFGQKSVWGHKCMYCNTHVQGAHVWNVRYMCCMHEILKGKDLSKGKILVVFLSSWLSLCVFYKANREISGRKIIILKVSRWPFQREYKEDKTMNFL